MKALFILLGHFLVTNARLLRPGSARAIVAESVLLKQQLVRGEFQLVAENQGFSRIAPDGGLTIAMHTSTLNGALGHAHPL